MMKAQILQLMILIVKLLTQSTGTYTVHAGDVLEDEEEEEDFEGFATEWKTDYYHPNHSGRFNRTPGVKGNIGLPANATPMQVFSLIFTEELWSRLVTETNTYMDRTRPEQLHPRRQIWLRCSRQK